MVESFFGLKREPFSIAPDPRFLYMSDKHREALAYLMYGLRRGGGFVLLTGEIGAGKTTVYRHFLEQLPGNIDVAYIANPKLGVTALLRRICEDLRVELPPHDQYVDPIDALQGHLLLQHAQGRRALIVVDEAQALSTDVLEQMRLLTNLVTNDRKLVQMLLIGQPELRTILEQPVLEPVAQRIVARFHLPSLSEGETGRYVAHRLAVAGLEGEMPFDPLALARIHKLCGGVPRRINVLCDRALFAAQSGGSRLIDSRIVDRAAAEVFGRPAPAAASPRAVTPAPATAPRRWPAWLALTGVAAAALVAGLALAPTIAPALSRSVAWMAPSRLPMIALPAPVPASAATPVVAVEPAPPPTMSAPTVVTLANASSTALNTSPDAKASATTPALAASAGTQNASLDALLAGGWTDEAGAWRALASLWGANLPAGTDPCGAALKQGLHCYRGRGGLAPIRELDRPGVLRVVDARQRVSYVVLLGLGGANATLRDANGNDLAVPLAQLARAWRGDYATFWKAPAGYREGEVVGTTGAVAPWVGERLGPPAIAASGAASAPGADETLRARVYAFQLAHGLEPDGVAGPLTLMQMNRESGVDEPRLKR
ncbi:MAG: AAA family ATPase [Proteobacteria bacterium]|nr:AAA family ATPase [Pseudomonadota bacterium]